MLYFFFFVRASLFCCRLTKAAPRRGEPVAVTGLRLSCRPLHVSAPPGMRRVSGRKPSLEALVGSVALGKGRLAPFHIVVKRIKMRAAVHSRKAEVKDTSVGIVLRPYLLTRPTTLLLFNFLFWQLFYCQRVLCVRHRERKSTRPYFSGSEWKPPHCCVVLEGEMTALL